MKNMLDKCQDRRAATRVLSRGEGTRSALLAAGAAMSRRIGQALSGSSARRFWSQSTPGLLRRRLAMTLAAAVVLWITATVILLGLEGTVQSVRGSTSPAYLDVIEAHEALLAADQAARQGFQTGEARFTGPGLQFQSDITSANQDLQRLAALSGSTSIQQLPLQNVSGQIVTYQALVEQAYAAYRTDIALGAADEPLGHAYLNYASHSMRDPGGPLDTIDGLGFLDRRTLTGQLASPFANPALFPAIALAGLLVLGTLIAVQEFVQRRFRRGISSPLLLAAALVCVLMAWMAIVILPADAAFAAARVTALQHLASAGASTVTATQSASNALDHDLAAAGSTAGLPIGIPALAAAIAALAWLGVKARMNEYRV